MTSKPDAFPSTQRTWINHHLHAGEEGLAEANRHIMSVYAWPLTVYYRGSSFRTMGDADELVNAFFADRLSRQEFLRQWQMSGRQLRHWLIVAFRHFLQEQRAAERRVRRSMSRIGSAGPEPAEPAHLFHREVALAIVREAVARTEAVCREHGLEHHWRIWVRHYLDGMPYSDMTEANREDVTRLKVMSRTVANRFRRALREIVAWPGATVEAVDEEIRSLIEVLG
jgi:hypothetical protein